MTHHRLVRDIVVSILAALLASAGCSSDPGLDDFLPPIPDPTGEPQSVWAGQITTDTEQVQGPAATGMVGDFFMRNSRSHYVIQAPSRFIGLIPQGGNVIDAVRLAPDGTQLGGDHFGEISFMYLLGRACRHDEIEVVRDGSDGGVAAIRARGVTEINDFINFRGLDVFLIPPELDPDSDDGVGCATTYVLQPDASSLSIQWTLYNPGEDSIRGPFAAFSDPGGEVDIWAPPRGFVNLGLDSLASAGDPTPVPYSVHQGPDVAYGVVPRYDDPQTPSAAFQISGASVVLFGADKLVDILATEATFLDLPGQKGMTFSLDLVLGSDPSDVEAHVLGQRGEAVAEVAGRVLWQSGSVPTGARVGLYRDSNGNSALDADDEIATYATMDDQGNFSARVAMGNYLLRAEVEDLARTPAEPIVVGAEGLRDRALTLPDPVYLDHAIKDGDGNFIPARITVWGRHPASPDPRIFDTGDRVSGAVRVAHSIRGTTVDIGDGADPRLALPAPGTYRIVASRGTEWSTASRVLDVQAGMVDLDIELVLHRVVPTDGYIASEYHVHQIGSMDSPVPYTQRIASMVAEGIEVFAATDHDFVSAMQPVVEAMGLTRQVRALPGLEVTPMAYGHFNGWPLDIDPTNPNFGAVDWARGKGGYALIPGEIFSALRRRGARVVQVNHPRSSSASPLSFFDRAGLGYDYENRQITGNLADAPVPNEFLRLPGVSLWDDRFDAVEVWTRMSVADSDNDGVREMASLDRVLRDWFNFLSLGLVTTPIGNSDTHSAFSRPPGMPRTYVRVSDDSARAIDSGDVVPEMLDVLSGQQARDVVVTNGPHITVSLAGDTRSVIGQEVNGQDGALSFDVTITSPAWAQVDTLEVFANATPDVPSEQSALKPLYCFTSRDPQDMQENDVCAQTTNGPQALNIQLITLPSGAQRYQTAVRVAVDQADIVNRAGATDGDAWLVFRTRGDRAIFPLSGDGVISDETLDILVSGTQAEIDPLLRGAGILATGFSGPVFVDFDGGGYTAVFSPQ